MPFRSQVWEQKVAGNYQRLNVLNLDNPVLADRLEILAQATNGCPDIRVFEVRAY